MTKYSDGELVKRGMAIAIVARRYSKQLAIVSEDGNRTFSEFNDNVNRLVRVLRRRGLRSGDALALLSPNRPEFMEVVFACFRSGLRITPINWHQSDDEIVYVADNCEAKALIACGGYFDKTLHRIVSCSSRIKACLVFGESVDGFENYEQVLAEEHAENICDPENGNYMLYTAGTTGKPKGVYRKQRALSNGLFNTIKETAQFKAGKDVSLVTGPLYHAVPFQLSAWRPLEEGVSCVLMNKWDSEKVLQLIETHRVSYVHFVPTMLQRLLALPDDVRDRYSLDSLRYVLHGAAPCPPSVKWSALRWLGPILYEYYGATEGGGVFCTPEQWQRKPGSVGTAVEGVTMKIFNDQGETLGDNEIGTVFFKKPANQFCYFKDSSKTESISRGDYFTIGDIGYLDSEGFLFLTGRSAELVICGGVNVYPAQIDNVLMEHPTITDVACIGVPNEEFGEEIKALVELAPGIDANEATIQSILDFIDKNLHGFMRPRSLEFINKLPRSEGGKILRKQLREKYGK